MRSLTVVTFAAAVLAVAVACLPQTSDGAERLTLTDGSIALRWGDGEYGVVLVPGEGENTEDWTALATEIAANRITVVVVDEADATPARLAAALDQVVLISADLTDAELAALGDVPKLFVAAEEEEAGVEAADRLVSLASGAWNAVLFVPGADRGPLMLDGEGSDELIEGVVARLEERR